MSVIRRAADQCQTLSEVADARGRDKDRPKIVVTRSAVGPAQGALCGVLPSK